MDVSCAKSRSRQPDIDGFVVIERNGSGVELRVLDYENPGSNPVLLYLNLGQVCSLYIAPVHSAV